MASFVQNSSPPAGDSERASYTTSWDVIELSVALQVKYALIDFWAA